MLCSYFNAISSEDKNLDISAAIFFRSNDYFFNDGFFLACTIQSKKFTIKFCSLHYGYVKKVVGISSRNHKKRDYSNLEVISLLQNERLSSAKKSIWIFWKNQLNRHRSFSKSLLSYLIKQTLIKILCFL